METFEVIFTDDANRDILESIEYYGAQQSGLDTRFIKELETVRYKLELHPQHYSQYLNTGLRGASMKHFPFQLLFRIEERTVVVFSVRHGSRKPLTE